MSGIYISGMEMPENCGECPMICDDDLCRITKGGRTLKERPPHCPLVAVPDHGRLIDADAVNDVWYGFAHYTGLLNSMLEDMPTIIPADKDVET